MLFASHDHQFIQTVATRVIELRAKGTEEYDMSYDDYLKKKGLE